MKQPDSLICFIQSGISGKKYKKSASKKHHTHAEDFSFDNREWIFCILVLWNIKRRDAIHERSHNNLLYSSVRRHCRNDLFFINITEGVKAVKSEYETNTCHGFGFKTFFCLLSFLHSLKILYKSKQMPSCQTARIVTNTTTKVTLLRKQDYNDKNLFSFKFPISFS